MWDGLIPYQSSKLSIQMTKFDKNVNFFIAICQGDHSITKSFKGNEEPLELEGGLISTSSCIFFNISKIWSDIPQKITIILLICIFTSKFCFKLQWNLPCIASHQLSNESKRGRKLLKVRLSCSGSAHKNEHYPGIMFGIAYNLTLHCQYQPHSFSKAGR